VGTHLFHSSLESLKRMKNESDETPHDSAVSQGWSVVDSNTARVQEPVGSSPSAQQDSSSGKHSSHAESSIGEETVRSEVSNVALVLYGVFGGLYLLYTVGWFLIAQYFSSVNELAAATSGSIGGVMQQVLFWVAFLAPMGWFTTVIVLSRTKKSWFLPVGLILGLIVLLPLPLFIVGSGA